MSDSPTINELKEALKLCWLEQNQNPSHLMSEKELKLILSSSDELFEMNSMKKEELIGKLFKIVNDNVSFGNLLAQKISLTKSKIKLLSNDTLIPVSILDNLIKDVILPINVPVLRLKKLLEKLSIRFQEAKGAIIKTFDIIYEKELRDLSINSSRVSFRKAYSDIERPLVSERKAKPDGRELYQNKDSLDMYLEKLSEQMNEINS